MLWGVDHPKFGRILFQTGRIFTSSFRYQQKFREKVVTKFQKSTLCKKIK